MKTIGVRQRVRDAMIVVDKTTVTQDLSGAR